MKLIKAVSLFSLLIIFSCNSTPRSTTKPTDSLTLFDYFHFEENENITMKIGDYSGSGDVTRVRLNVKNIMEPGVYIQEVILFHCSDLKNSVTRLKLSPQVSADGLITRLKIKYNSYVYVVALTSKNQVVIADKRFKPENRISCLNDSKYEEEPPLSISVVSQCNSSISMLRERL